MKSARGDVLALIDAAEVGKVKAEFQQALTQVALKTQTHARLRDWKEPPCVGENCKKQ